MNPICKILGHKYDKDEFGCPYGVMTCNRCGTVTDWNYPDVDDGTLGIPSFVYIIKLRLITWWNMKTGYFQKCPDCGKRFNKHTNNCAPF